MGLHSKCVSSSGVQVIPNVSACGVLQAIECSDAIFFNTAWSA